MLRRVKQDEIYRAVREDILACRLHPGAELREQSLAARLGCSKSPVREALLRLAGDCLVSIRPRQGYRVTPVSVPAAADLLQFRAVIELACARTAARDATVAQRAALQDAARLDQASCSDPASFIAYNRRFHTMLTACSGNARLARAGADAVAQADRLVYLSLGAMRGRNPLALAAEHEALAACIAAGDARAAVAQLRRHLDEAGRRILGALSDLETKAAASGATNGDWACLQHLSA